MKILISESVGRNQEWFDNLSKKSQKAYLADYPNSKFGKAKTATKPAATKPAATKPAATKPAAAKPAAAKPAAAKPAAAKPAAAKPAAAKPATLPRHRVFGAADKIDPAHARWFIALEGRIWRGPFLDKASAKEYFKKARYEPPYKVSYAVELLGGYLKRVAPPKEAPKETTVPKKPARVKTRAELKQALINVRSDLFAATPKTLMRLRRKEKSILEQIEGLKKK